ncbi:MAG TPA: GAF and ANTAR domain-containing protein [Jatrophihabitans sp.]|nr:GAF and ANTAR domain-containing protein [Jatrophihabitans sp.]
MESPRAYESRRSGAAYASFARRVSGSPDITSARAAVVECAVDMLGVPWVALTRYRPTEGVKFAIKSDDVVHRVAKAAMVTGEGISWEIFREHAAVVVTDDLTAETRWPQYRQTVGGEPVRSAVGAALRYDGEEDAALILYSDVPAAFRADRLEHVIEFADHAAISLAHASARVRAANLELAVRTSREIAMAIGIVMERLRMSEQDAFHVLRQSSQERHVKLRDVASYIVLTGDVRSSDLR